MEIRGSQESQDSLIKTFGQAVEFEYSRQSSTPTPPKWIHMRELVNLLKRFKNVTIIGNEPQRLFIEDLLMYIELVMGFLSNYDDTEYRKQRNYGKDCLTFIPEIFKDVAFKSMFIQEATVKTLDLFMYGNFNLVSKKTLLVIYNEIAAQSKKHVRQEVANGIMYYMYKLLDCLSTYGDYVIQSDVMETLFRIFGHHIRNNEKIVNELLPGSDDLGKALTTEISVNQFDADVRTWLNRFNQDSPYIFSIVCKKIMFGNQVCLPPEDRDKTWVDFNLKEPMLSFYCQGSSPDSWNRLTIIAKDVKKVEVKRPLGANESTVSIQMFKSCISEEHGSQDYYDKLEKLLILIISHEEKDKITKLITTVLPQVFGDTFSHTSAKISAKPRNVYKPLPIKVSRRKSGASDVSIATTLSKSKSDGATIDHVKVSGVIPVRKSLLPGSVDSHQTAQSKTVVSASDHIRHSSSKPGLALENNVSVGTITDMTRYSHRSNLTSDHITIITSENLDIFPSSKPTSPINPEDSICSRRKGYSKVQDNNTTSSLGEDSIGIEILSGKCSGRSTDYQRLVHEGFHHSEVFSSSPIKISKQTNLQDISNAFSPSPPLQDDVKQDNYGYRTENIRDPKVSCLTSQEETLDEDFETAVENMENEFLNIEKYLHEPNKISLTSDVRKGQYTLKESDDEKDKVSQFKMQIHYSKIADKAEKNFSTLLQNKSKGDFGHVQDGVDSDEKSAEELRIVQKSRDQFSDNSLEGGKEASLVPTIDEKPSDEISMDSTTMQGNVPISDRAKNDVLLDNEDVRISLINDNNALFTEDIYEAATQEYNKITDSAKVLEEHGSEDVFNRPQFCDQTIEEFTPDLLSLIVNVGISDTPYIDNKKDTKEDIIDLTLDDHTDDERESCVEEEKREVKLRDNKKKYVLKKVGATKKPLLNTPELLDILSTDNPMNKCLTETGQNQKDDTTHGKENLTSSIESYPVKEMIVKKTAGVIGKRKHRTLLKTGKKRFDMDDDVEEVQIVRATDKNENEQLEKQDQAEKTKPVMHNFDEENTEKANCFEQSSKEKNSVQGTSVEQASKTSNIQENNIEQFNKEIVGIKMINEEEKANCLEESSKEINSVQGPSVEQASNTSNIQENNIEQFNEAIVSSKMINEEDLRSSPHPFSFEPITKHLKVLLTQIDVKNKLENSTSSSELELAPEVNMDNVDYIEKSNILKQSDEENRLVKENQKVAEAAVGSSVKVTELTENQPKQHIENKESSSRLEVDEPSANNEIVENIDSSDKLTEDFILKKSARRLLDSLEEQSKNDLDEVTISIVDKEINLEPAKTLETEKKQVKLSRIVNKGTKAQRKQPKRRKSKVVVINGDQQESISPSNLTSLKDDNHQIDRDKKLNEKELGADFTNDIGSQNNQIKETVAPIHAICSRDNENDIQEEVLGLELVPPTTYSDLDDQEIDQHVKVIPRKTPDSSPELISKTVVTVAQVHWVEGCSKPDEGKKKTETLKSSSNYPGQDCQILQSELHISSKKENDKYKQKYEFFDEILGESATVSKKTRSSDRIKKKLDGDFDKLAAAIPLNNSTINKSEINTTGTSKRKLFNPGNLSYLDEMPDITERKTPELDEMPIAVVKGTKMTKRKKAELLNEAVKPKPADKSKTIMERSNKNKKSPKEKIPKESSKPQTKPRSKRGRRKEFSLSTTKFMDLADLFNTTCRSLRNNALTGGYNALYRPIDIAARSAPQPLSSDESPVGFKSVYSKKQTSPVQPDTFGLSPMPPTPEYNSSEFEIELPPINKKVPGKINILQDIIIKPKRPSRDYENENNKRRKLNPAEIVENIPAPTLPESINLDDKVNPMQSINENNNYEDNKIANPIVEACLEEIIKLQKDVSKRLEVSLQKIKALKE